MAEIDMSLLVGFDLPVGAAPFAQARKIEWRGAHDKLRKDGRRNRSPEAQLAQGVAERALFAGYLPILPDSKGLRISRHQRAVVAGVMLDKFCLSELT